MYIGTVSLAIEREVKSIPPKSITDVIIKLFQESLHKERKFKFTDKLCFSESLLFLRVDKVIDRMFEDGV